MKQVLVLLFLLFQWVSQIKLLLNVNSLVVIMIMMEQFQSQAPRNYQSYQCSCQ